MAIGRISGQMLKSNLLRSGTDLAFETNLLVLDVTNSRVGVGTASPATTFHVSATDALRLPSGNNSQRPGTPANGDIRYNSESGQIEGYASSAWSVLSGGTSLFDADGDTTVDVERSADEDTIHFATAGTDRAHIRPTGEIELNNLQISGTTVSSLTTNGDINITPNGTGQTVIKNLSVTDGLDLGDLNALNVGDINVDSVSSDNGTDFDILLDDNQATALEIKEGANAYMTFDTTDSAEVITSNKPLTVATGQTFTTDTADINGGNIDGTTIGGASAAAGTFTTATATTAQVNGDITVTGSVIADTIVSGASNANIAITPSGTGEVDISKVDIDSGSIDGVAIGSNSAATALVANGGINIDDDGDGAIDGVVIGANTAAAGTFTTLETSGAVTVGGDLTVNGTTTTIDSTTLTVEDPLIQLAKNNSGGSANTFDQGLFFNRGSDDNVSFIWDESADEFAFAVTSGEDGTTAGNVTIDSYASIHVGGITNSGAFATDGLSVEDNNITGTRSNDDINITPSGTGSVVIGKADINGGAVDGTVIGANSAAAGTFTDLTANGTIDIDSTGTGNIDNVVIGANTAADGTFNTVTVNTALDVGDNNITNVGDIALDSISADDSDIDITLTDNSATALEIKEGSNAYLTFDTTNSAEVITAGQNLTVASDKTLTATTAQINGDITINGQVVADTIVSAASNANIAITPSGTGEVDISKVDIASGEIDGTAIGANSASTGSFTTLNTSGEVVFNDAGAAVDFRVEGDTDTDLLVVDGSADQIGISTAAGSIAYVLDASGSTDAFRLPQGNTAARPTAATGIIRFNTQTGKYEGCQDGSTYIEFAVAGDTPIFSKATATGDGSTQTFNGFFATAPANANNVFVYIDNVYQEPTENYTVASTNITFTSAPHSGARIFAITGADNTALASGGVARSETSSTNFTSSATDILTFNASDFRAAEVFIVTTDSANSEYEVAKALIVHDGSTAYVTVYGQTSSTGSDLSTYSVTLSGGSVKLQAVSAGGQQSAKVQYSLAA